MERAQPRMLLLNVMDLADQLDRTRRPETSLALADQTPAREPDELGRRDRDAV